MRSLTVAAGHLESEPCILANCRLSTVFVPASIISGVEVTILASFDGVDYGVLYGTDGNPVTFPLHDHYSVQAFDPDDFNGVQYFKFLLNIGSTEPLIFHIHIMDT